MNAQRNRLHVEGAVQVQHAQVMASFMELGHGGYVIMHLSQVAARDIATQDVFGTFSAEPYVAL